MVILDNVPRMMWGVDKEITLVQAVECCLRYIGYDIDYDELACASGMAFSLKWKNDEPCPSAGTIEDPLYIDRLFRYVGLGYSVIYPDSPGFGEAITASLDKGSPVIVQGGFNVPDFYVLAGYDPDKQLFYGRTPFDESDKYASTNQSPLRAIIIGGEISERPSGLARLYYPLHSAVLAYNHEMSAEGWESNYQHSFEAYDEWISQLMTPELWSAVDEKKLDLHVHTNEWVFNVLYTSRLAAGRFLMRTANFHNKADSEKIMFAGRIYYIFAKVLHQRGFTAFGTGYPEEGYPKKYLLDPAKRLEWAGVLKQAAERDRLAYEQLAAVAGGI